MIVSRGVGGGGGGVSMIEGRLDSSVPEVAVRESSGR